jgi:hypothetical protein
MHPACLFFFAPGFQATAQTSSFNFRFPYGNRGHVFNRESRFRFASA